MSESEPPVSTRRSSEFLEMFVDKGVVEVAEHEFTHIVALWGLGKTVKEANTIKQGPQLGVTIPAGELSPGQFQIAAMASAEHAGNGSDKLKAYIMEPDSGMSMEMAAAVARGIIGSYRKEVLHAAAVYLAFYQSADDAMLRKFLRWAEEDVRKNELYKDLPIPSWSDELAAKQEEEQERLRQSGWRINVDESILENISKIKYAKDGIQTLITHSGADHTFCTHCQQLDGHTTQCINFRETEHQLKKYVIVAFGPKRATPNGNSPSSQDLVSSRK